MRARARAPSSCIIAATTSTTRALLLIDTRNNFDTRRTYATTCPSSSFSFAHTNTRARARKPSSSALFAKERRRREYFLHRRKGVGSRKNVRSRTFLRRRAKMHPPRRVWISSRRRQNISLIISACNLKNPPHIFRDLGFRVYDDNVTGFWIYLSTFFTLIQNRTRAPTNTQGRTSPREREEEEERDKVKHDALFFQFTRKKRRRLRGETTTFQSRFVVSRRRAAATKE